MRKENRMPTKFNETHYALCILNVFPLKKQELSLMFATTINPFTNVLFFKDDSFLFFGEAVTNVNIKFHTNGDVAYVYGECKVAYCVLKKKFKKDDDNGYRARHENGMVFLKKGANDLYRINIY